MKHLLITGDDFGKSTEVNAAIERYHISGALTQASLMVNEPAVDEATRIARRNPTLCVGLHLTLCDGRAARLSSITNRHGFFSPSPAFAGLNYAFSPAQQNAISAEIERQFSAFAALGFEPTYWDGHHHIHLHPTVLKLTLPIAQRYGFQAVRLVREPFPWHLISAIFRLLSRKAKPQLEQRNIGFVDRVYGLKRTGRMETRALQRLLLRLPQGWSELYLHPGAEQSLPPPELFAEMLNSSSVQLSNSLELLESSAIGSVPAHSPVSAGAI